MRLVAAIVLALTLCATRAQAACAPHDFVVKFLRDTFGEVLASSGETTGGDMLEIYVSELGTWTAVLVKGTNACIGADGKDWKNKDEKPGRKA